MTPLQQAQHIYQSSTPILRINGLGGRTWCRNDRKPTKRTGPWLPADYDVLNREAWEAEAPGIYFVAGDDGNIRYTGISRNGVHHRWRECPAIDTETRTLRPRRELHHSQCWQHVEREFRTKTSARFEVRCITAPRLMPVLMQLGAPLSGFAPLAADHEGLVGSVERWLCNKKSMNLVSWNVAMTGTPLRV